MGSALRKATSSRAKAPKVPCDFAVPPPFFPGQLFLALRRRSGALRNDPPLLCRLSVDKLPCNLRPWYSKHYQHLQVQGRLPIESAMLGLLKVQR